MRFSIHYGNGQPDIELIPDTDADRAVLATIGDKTWFASLNKTYGDSYTYRQGPTISGVSLSFVAPVTAPEDTASEPVK